MQALLRSARSPVIACAPGHAGIAEQVEVLPGARVLHEPARWQQLAVVAHFADGSARDVESHEAVAASYLGL